MTFSPEEQPLPPMTAPPFTITFPDINAEDANRFGPLLGAYVQEVSRYIDLSGLDGITVAFDYPTALAKLDRGFKTNHVLTPTSEFGVGIAMTSPVMRGDSVKSHIVFDARYIFPLEDNSSELWSTSFHILAHECAHVAVTQATDRAFPGIILRLQYEDMLSSFRWQITDACWDEYAACRISAGFGSDSTSSYEETLLTALKETRALANGHIRDYRHHGDHARVFAEVAEQYGALMKFSSYLLGHLHGAGLERDAAPKATEALQKHWFSVHFDKLEQALSSLWHNFGSWKARAEFEPIGGIAEAVIHEGGIRVTRMGQGQIYVDVPFTAHTMPAASPLASLLDRWRSA